MAKKGPGRGRRNIPKEARIKGQFPKKSASVTTTTTTVVAPPSSAPAAVPSGPTITPEIVTEQVSGFRKAILQTMKELGVEESELQDALLDGLRETAERLVTENERIFGKRYDKTVEQSAAYEILEGVVRLSEAAAKAKTVAEKRKILQRLQTYKKVAQNVFSKGDPKQEVIVRKIMEMIAKIEEPLAKESGKRAAIKESIKGFAKTIPERMARKIPLIGGLLGGYLQRRRERKEEEGEALSSLTEEISRAGRTSLYGRKFGDLDGDIGLGASPDITPPESPIPGGTRASSLRGMGVGFSKDSTQTLKAILLQVSDIKNLLIGEFDPKEKKLKEEEAKREGEDTNIDMISKLKKMMGMGGGGGGAKGGGIGDFIGTALKGIVEYVPVVAQTIAGFAPAIMGGLAAAAPWAGAALGGAAIGLGGAYLVNKGIDSMFGTNLSEKMFEADTWTFGDVERDRKRAELDKKVEAAHQAAVSSPDYIKRAAQDWTRLPELVRKKDITGTEALKILSDFEAKNGAGPDTDGVRKRIKEIDPSAIETTPPPLPPIPTGTIMPSVGNNPSQQYLNNLEQGRDALRSETLTTTGGSVNSVVAPQTTNNNVTVNTPQSSGVRNNDPTLKAAERASL